MIIKFESQILRGESLGSTLKLEVWTFSQLSKKKQELPGKQRVRVDRTEYKSTKLAAKPDPVKRQRKIKWKVALKIDSRAL